VAGAPFKLAAAQAVGAHVFFTPAVLEDELAALPHDKVRLVPVSSVGDALYFLCASGATDAVCSKVL
jgi:PDZ domain-containing secreted protein